MLAKVANLQTKLSNNVVAGEVKCVKCGRVIRRMAEYGAMAVRQQTGQNEILGEKRNFVHHKSYKG